MCTVVQIAKLRIQRELNHWLVEHNSRTCTYNECSILIDDYETKGIPFGVNDLGYDLQQAREDHISLEEFVNLPII